MRNSPIVPRFSNDTSPTSKPTLTILFRYSIAFGSQKYTSVPDIELCKIFNLKGLQERDFP